MKKSFTLLEILIVVAVIALIAAIAIPSLIAYRINANESAAIANLRMLHGVLATYAAANNGFYPTYFGINTSPQSELWTANPKYLNDPAFGTCNYQPGGYARLGYGTKQGYLYMYNNSLTDPRNYTLYAQPSYAVDSTIDYSITKYRGRRYFRLSSSGIIEQGNSFFGPWYPLP